MSQKLDLSEIPQFIWGAGALLVSTFLPWVSTFVGSQDLWDLIDKGMIILDKKWASSGDFFIFLGLITLLVVAATGPLVLVRYFTGRIISSAVIAFFGGLISTLGLGLMFITYMANDGASSFSLIAKPGYGFYAAIFCSLYMIARASKVLEKVWVGKNGIKVDPSIYQESFPKELESANSETASYSVSMPQVSMETVQKPLEIIQLGADEFQDLIKQNGVYSFAGGIGLGALAVTQPWVAGLIVGGAVIGCGMKKKKSLSEIPASLRTEEKPQNEDQSPAA